MRYAQRKRPDSKMLRPLSTETVFQLPVNFIVIGVFLRKCRLSTNPDLFISLRISAAFLSITCFSTNSQALILLLGYIF